MTRLIVTADAEADTNRILDYLAREAGQSVADDYGRRFQTTIKRLVRMPGSGPPRRALGPAAHIAIVYPYILIYDYVPEDDAITLLRILHGRRNITRDLLNR